jgi:hypothetical protein
LSASIRFRIHLASRREVLRRQGQLAEVSLNTRADLRVAFAQSRVTRRATALFLYADSVVLHDPDGHAELLRAEARSLLAAGPDPLTRGCPGACSPLILSSVKTCFAGI